MSTKVRIRMKQRILFNPSKYLEDVKQAHVEERKLVPAYATSLKDTSIRRMSLQEAANKIYEHLAERSKRDDQLHEDILNAGLGEPMSQERIKAVIDTLLMEYRIEIDSTTLIDDLTTTECVFAETCGASLIEDLYRLPDVEEVQVIGFQIFILRNGQKYLHHRKFASLKQVRLLQERLALCGKKPISEKRPVIQSYLWNRSRLVMTREPYSDVPSIFIRNFIIKDVSLWKLVEPYRTLNTTMAELLTQLVRYHASFLIGGGTTTGKTTFLFALAQEIPENERIRTLEKEFEVALRERLHGERNILATREVEDIGLNMEEAFKPLLVMSPHWVIVGEAEGSEVSQMVQGALRGHDVMGTIHTKFRASFISDVVEMIKQDGRQHDHRDTQKRIARAFNIIIFLRIIKINGEHRRVATEITE